MGQCPSHPQRADNEDFAIATRPSPLGWPSGRSQPTNEKEPVHVKTEFLKLHRPDRGQKCILDPTEVYSALHQQAEEIMQRKGLVHEDSSIPMRWEDFHARGEMEMYQMGGNSVIESQSVYTGAPSDFALSDFAPSDYTTATGATRVAGNTFGSPGREEANNGYSVMADLNGGAAGMSSQHLHQDAAEEPNVLRAPSGKHLGQSGGHPVVGTNPSQQRQQQRKYIWEKYGRAFAACVQPRDEMQSRREDYMSVLHLRMKAHLGYYYTRKYLPTFPNAPRPPGYVSRFEGEVPHLVSEDSDSSSSSSGASQIGFGDIPPSTAVMSSVTGSIFMDLAVTGSLGLVPRHGHILTKADRYKDQKSPDHYIVLMNRRSGVPLAVCALKTTRGLPIVRIYATKQRVFNQRSAATTKQLGLDWSTSLPLYAWAEIVTESMSPEPESFAVYMASGSEGRFSAAPSYRASFEVENGAPHIRVLGRTEKEARQSGCALISFEDSDSDDEDLRFKVDVAHGIDPALLVCFTAVFDEILEKSMRLRCKQERRKHKRQARTY